jgi:hypothetical protein
MTISEQMSTSREETMYCIFLTGNKILSCKAYKGVYVPSLFELEEYCTNTRHKLCQVHADAKAAIMKDSSRDAWPPTGYVKIVRAGGTRLKV